MRRCWQKWILKIVAGNRTALESHRANTEKLHSLVRSQQQAYKTSMRETRQIARRHAAGRITAALASWFVTRALQRAWRSWTLAVKVAKMSELVKTMIPEDADDDEEAQEIPLPNVKSTVLAKVIEFCRHYAEEAMSEIEKPLKSANMHEVVQEWYANYVDVDQELLFELILAANYMDIKPLLDLTCATVASMIKGKTPEEIRKTFNIVNDFTPEEEAQVREENKWCEEIGRASCRERV